MKKKWICEKVKLINSYNKRNAIKSNLDCHLKLGKFSKISNDRWDTNASREGKGQPFWTVNSSVPGTLKHGLQGCWHIPVAPQTPGPVGRVPEANQKGPRPRTHALVQSHLVAVIVFSWSPHALARQKPLPHNLGQWFQGRLVLPGHLSL